MELPVDEILKEIKAALTNLDREKVESFVSELISHERIFVAGAGRSRLVAEAFATRLVQLGKEAYVAGEPTSPNVEKGDLFVAISGSGETRTTLDLTKAAKGQGAEIWVITAKPDSSLAEIGNNTIHIKARTKYDGFSVQPLASTFEQSALIFLDAIIVVLMKRMGVSEDEMEERHTKVE